MAKDKVSKKYHKDIFKYKAAKTHNSFAGFLMYAAAVAGVSAYSGHYMYENAELPQFELADQTTQTGNLAYERLSTELNGLVQDQTAIKQLRVDIAQADLEGRDTAALEDEMAYNQSRLTEDLRSYYGQLMSDRMISETQFDDLRNRLVDADMSSIAWKSGDRSYEVNLEGLNAATFQECQMDVNFDDNGLSAFDANSVENCMAEYNDVAGYKSDASLWGYLGSVPVSGLLFFLIGGAGIRPRAQRVIWKRRPNKQDYLLKDAPGN